MTNVTDRNRERAQRFVEEVMSLQDVDAIEELAAPPSQWHEQVETRDGTPLETYTDAKAWLTRVFSKFEDWSLSVGSVFADESEAVAVWQASGRVTEEWFGVPATGRPFETVAATFFQFEDGRITGMHDFLDTMAFMPEVAKVARQGVVGEMRDGIVVIDNQHQIVDVNPAIVETFARDRETLLGEPVARLIGADTSPPTPGDAVVITGPGDRRYFEVEASPLSNPEGDRIGRTLVVHEVTERRRHVQQLEVLNRVLRHNLRNDLTVVAGTLEAVRERADDEVGPMLSEAAASTADLLETAETARAVQAALADATVDRRDLGSIVDRVVGRAHETYPGAMIDAPTAPVPAVEATRALEDALWELVENACKYAGERPDVAVTVTQNSGTVEVAIADDGPGIPAHEQSVLQAGEETDLDHGSGLGLWLAYWVLEASGGDLAFTVDDGTTVRATLPAASTN